MQRPLVVRTGADTSANAATQCHSATLWCVHSMDWWNPLSVKPLFDTSNALFINTATIYAFWTFMFAMNFNGERLMFSVKGCMF